MNRRGDRVQGRRAHGGVLLVPCEVNDVARYWFLVDTGAALSIISTRAAEEVGVDLARPLRMERVASVHRVTPVPVVRLGNLQVGSQRLTGVETLVLEFPLELRLEGLLGINVLEKFRVTFEFDQSTLVLR